VNQQQELRQAAAGGVIDGAFQIENEEEKYHQSQSQPLNLGDLAVQEPVIVNHGLGAAELLHQLAGIVAPQSKEASGILEIKSKRTTNKQTNKQTNDSISDTFNPSFTFFSLSTVAEGNTTQLGMTRGKWNRREEGSLTSVSLDNNCACRGCLK